MKHVFFDMDGTLTESRMFIDPEMSELVNKLRDQVDIVVVSGAEMGQIATQIGVLFQRVGLLAQNGNDAMDPYGERLWRNVMNWVQKQAVFAWIDGLLHGGAVDVGFGSATAKVIDLVEDRGCQISYSAIGHHASLHDKAAYDPDGSKRRAVLVEHPFTFTADAFGDIKVAIGGTTCLDFYTRTKGENVRAYLERMKWDPMDCVYVGDALFPGGNDESVIGVVKCVKVANPGAVKDWIRDFTHSK